MTKIVLAAAFAAMLASLSASSPVLAGDVYFKNCKAAAAAGYSNMARGTPGYAPHLDRDDDGIACETGHSR